MDHQGQTQPQIRLTIGRRQPPRPSALPLMAGGAALLLSACQPKLDSDAVADSIHQELEPTSLPVEAVDCPEGIPLADGESFQCWGELPEGAFAIDVQQEDEAGTVNWEISSSQRVLNLSDLEAYFRNEIRSETGSLSDIDCGGIYRVNQPGDSFDCQLSEAIPLEDDLRQLEAIQVQLDSQGNVNWQQVHNLAGEEGAGEADGAIDEGEAGVTDDGDRASLS
ncbi:MAG: DUF4333 domain-containing protein [Cyanobacteria bacterium P01_A01_bin.135]